MTNLKIECEDSVNIFDSFIDFYFVGECVKMATFASVFIQQVI